MQEAFTLKLKEDMVKDSSIPDLQHIAVGLPSLEVARIA